MFIRKNAFTTVALFAVSLFLTVITAGIAIQSSLAGCILLGGMSLVSSWVTCSYAIEARIQLARLFHLIAKRDKQHANAVDGLLDGSW